MADEFDPQAFVSGTDTQPAPEPTPELQGEPLPVRNPSLTTFYYPSTPEDTRAQGLSYSMEGGIHGAGPFSDLDLRNHTLEQFMSGNSPFVAVATKDRKYGETWQMDIAGVPVVATNVDTGGGLKDGQVDVATANPELARHGVERQFDPEAFVKGTPPPIPPVKPSAPAFDPEAFVAGAAQPIDTQIAEEQPAQTPIPVPSPQPMPTPGQQAYLPPVMSGTLEGLRQTAMSMIPTTMDQFKSLAQMLNAPSDPQRFFTEALKQGLVDAKIAQDAIKAGPLSKEAGIAYGTIIPQALMMMAGARAPEALKYGQEVQIPEAFQPKSDLPDWARAEMTQRGLNPNRTFNDIDLGNPSVKDAIKNDPTLSPEQKQQLLSTGDLGPPSKPPAPPGQPPIPPQPPPQPPLTPQQTMTRKQVVRGVTSGYDSVFTMADYGAHQQVNPLRQDFGWDFRKGRGNQVNAKPNRDLEAATFIAEAQGNKVALQHDAELIRQSKDPKLAAKYGPIIQHALENFNRIASKLQLHQDLMQNAINGENAAGIQYGEREGYVTHVLKNEPDNELLSFFTRGKSGAGFSKYFTKNREFNSLAEAINAGVDPRSVNLADLDQHRIASGRRLILQNALFDELKTYRGPDGQPIVKGIGYYLDDQGKVRTAVPKGYERVTANGVDLAVHPEYTGIFKALYGDSAWRRSPEGRGFLKAVGLAKSVTLAADTFHGMRGIEKGLFYGGKGSRVGYNRGVTVYELSDAALDRAVQDGQINRYQAAWAKEARPAIEAMMRKGLNVAKFSDNLVGQMHGVPGFRAVNSWIFDRVFRGAMIQASHANYLRNLSRFPELTADQVAAKTARQMNEVFGNLQNQGLFRDKTVQDALRVIFLAPQWVESQVRAELRGYGEAGKVIPDAMNGKFRVGVVAQGQATAIAAFLLGNQIINYATTGHSTFENEGGHKLSAYIPIGRGLYLDPFALSAEYADKMVEMVGRAKEGTPLPRAALDAASQMARYKLSKFAQPVVTLATGRDVFGHEQKGYDVFKSAAIDAVPSPIFLNAFLKRDATSPVGLTVSAQPDKIMQQVLQSIGLKAQLAYPGAPTRLSSGPNAPMSVLKNSGAFNNRARQGGGRLFEAGSGTSRSGSSR